MRTSLFMVERSREFADQTFVDLLGEPSVRRSFVYRLSCGELDLAIHVSDEYAERPGRDSVSPPVCQSDRWRSRGNLLLRAIRRRWLNMELECEQWAIGTLVANRTIQGEDSMRRSLSRYWNVSVQAIFSRLREGANP